MSLTVDRILRGGIAAELRRIAFILNSCAEGCETGSNEWIALAKAALHDGLEALDMLPKPQQKQSEWITVWTRETHHLLKEGAWLSLTDRGTGYHKRYVGEIMTQPETRDGYIWGLEGAILHKEIPCEE